MELEVWRPVVGAEELYQVSNLGRVKSLHCIGRPAKDGILVATPNKKGYLRVGLSINRIRYATLVHLLVLEAFVGSSPSGIHECNHKNTLKNDNRETNLEWVTPIENNAHSVANNLWKPHKGEAHGRAVLTEQDVCSIRSLKGIESSNKIAPRYGVTASTIQRIWSRKLWRHIA